MSRIIIDARESGTTSGRYVDKLVENLHKIAPEEPVTILTKTKRVIFFETIAPNYITIVSNFKEFTLAEQLGLAKQLYNLKPDLVHFSMTQQPIVYFGKSVTTIHDLTTLRFTNSSKNFIVFKLKQIVYRGVVLWAAHKSKIVMTISEYVKKDIQNFTHIKFSKITVAYESADKISEKSEPIKYLTGQAFIMYVGRPQPHKNL